MTDPWFRRFAGFSYRPTTWQGRTVIAIMAAVFITCGPLWMSLVDAQPTLAWVIPSVGFLTAVGGRVVVLWKMDRDYTGAICIGLAS